MTKGKELLIRTRTAIVFAAVMLGGICWNVYSYLALTAFIMLASIYEFQQVLKPRRAASKVSGWYLPLSCFIALMVFATGYGLVMGQLPAGILIVLPIMLFLFVILELFGSSADPFSNSALNVLGIIYLCIPFVTLHFVAIRAHVYEFKIVIAILFLIWANDSFAYLAGSRFGRHKMLPRISPGKTWEGFVGGVAGSVGTGLLMYRLFGIQFLALTDWICLGIVVSIAATLGDLVESMLKRSLQIKDTGNILPGHGGILDRFDAFYFAIPFVAFYLFAVGKL